MTQEINKFDEGCRLLELARLETARPSTDVVSVSACHYAKMAIVFFLKHYLEQHGKNAEQYHTLEEMVKEAGLINNEVLKLPVNELHCKENHIHSYCMELENIQSCIDIANEFKTIAIG